MIKLHTKYKSNLNYYLFTVDKPNDINQVTQSFQILFDKEPIFSSCCDINNKSYALIGTLELYKDQKFVTDDFPYTLLQIFPGNKKNQNVNNPQLETFYLCNFKDKSIIDLFLIPLLNDLIKWNIAETSIKKIPSDETPQIIYFQCAPDEYKHRVRILIPFFINNELSSQFDFPAFTTKSSELPVIVVKNINQDSQNQINPENFAKIKKHIETNNYSKVINSCESKSWFYFSVEDNNKAWDIINRLKYSTYHKEYLQFTHFLDYTEMEQSKQWNLLVVNIDKKEDDKSIFERFSQFNNEDPDSNEIKKITAIKTYLDSNTINAKVQFLNKSDAYEVFHKDSNHIKMLNFSMVVHHFDAGKEEELYDIFPKASYILEKQNNSPRTRPVYQVFFDSKKDLSDALLISGNIDENSIKNENDDEVTNKKYVYQLTAGNKGIYSNGLRAFCIAYMNQLDVNRVDFHLTKQTWKKNTVEILNVHPTVQLSEAIEALTSFNANCCLESLVFWKNKKIIAAYLQNKYFKMATSKKTIEINGCEYTIHPKNSS